VDGIKRIVEKVLIRRIINEESIPLIGTTLPQLMRALKKTGQGLEKERLVGRQRISVNTLPTETLPKLQAVARKPRNLLSNESDPRRQVVLPDTRPKNNFEVTGDTKIEEFLQSRSSPAFTLLHSLLARNNSRRGIMN